MGRSRIIRRARIARYGAAGIASFVAITLGLLAISPVAHAATDPSLGTAASFGVLSQTFTNGGATTINGDLGYTIPSVDPATVNGNSYHPPSAQTGIDQGSALSTLNSDSGACVNLPNTDLSLAPDHSAGQAPGVYAPGVYCTSGAASTGTGITLIGSGTYVFLIDGALTSVADQPAVTLTGSASSCDVWWAPTGGTTLGAETTLGPTPNFIGTDIDASGISVGANVNWAGRALAYGGTVTTVNDTISASTCFVGQSGGGGGVGATTSCIVTSSANPSTVGQSVTFTATVTGANPTGNVTFADLSTIWGTAALNAGQATFTTSTLVAGNDPVLVFYGGNSLNSSCEAGSFVQVVNAGTAASTLPVVAPVTPPTTPVLAPVVTPVTTPTSPAPTSAGTGVTPTRSRTPAKGVTTLNSTSVPIAPKSTISTSIVSVTG